MPESTAVDTVKVVCDWREEGWVLLDKPDFDKKVHKLWTEPKPEPADKPSDADNK